MEMISNGGKWGGGGKFTDRLARMFRRKNSCSSSSATSVSATPPLSSSGNTSSRTLLSNNPLRSLSTLDHRVSVDPKTSITARVSVDCGACRPSRDNFVSNPVQVRPLPVRTGTTERIMRKNNGAGTKMRIEKKKKKRLCNNGYGFSESSFSSMESDGGYGMLFSSDEDGTAAHRKTETEAFFSSKSFSSDSSEFYSKPYQSCNLSKKKTKQMTTGRRRRRVVPSCQNCSVKELGLKPAAVAKKGFAVVKKTSDPYADFRNSMVEMIVERQIFGEEDLEKLLHSYLSLNSPRHHPVILQAFSDIWVVLFGN